MVEFDGTLERAAGPGAWTTVAMPAAASAALGGRRAVRVRGTINGRPFRSSAMPRGDGTFFLVVNREMRAATNAAAGDRVHVIAERDDAPSELEVPDELAAALATSTSARDTWTRLAPSHKRQYASWIADAKTAATRKRRVDRAIDLLARGKRLRDTWRRPRRCATMKKIRSSSFP